MFSDVTKLAKQEMAESLVADRPLIAFPYNQDKKSFKQSERALNPDRKDLDHDTN